MPLSPFHDKANVTKEEELDNDTPLHDDVMQPMTPQTAHITPPDDVAPATSPMLDKHLYKFGEDFSNITRIAEKADNNPVTDVKEFSNIIKTYDSETFIRKLLRQIQLLEQQVVSELVKKLLIKRRITLKFNRVCSQGQVKERGLSQVEARLIEFKTQEIKFCEKIRGLEFDVESKNNKIKHLMNELKKVKKEKEGLDSKLTGFESASKDLDTLLGSQRTDKNKEGLPEFADDTITDYSRPSPSIESNTSDLQNSNSSVSELGESSGSIMSKPMIKFVKAADSPTVIKTNKTETSRKPPVKDDEMYRNTSQSPKVRGNQRNWNNLKSQQLGIDFVMQNKACFKCGHFDHLAYDCGVWVEQGKNWSKNKFAHKNVTPRAVVLKTGRTPIAVNRTNMNVAQPKIRYFVKTSHSNVRRPFQRKSAVRTQSQVPRVSTVCCCCSRQVNTARPKAVINRRNWFNDVKALACWV
nr:ubiquitin hydrolase [Tanacetum cinerariifolium]